MLEVLVGTNDVTKGGQFYQIEKFSVHKEFAGPKRYDIATVRVQGKIEFNANVQPIELLLTDDVPDGSEVTFTGFGRLSVIIGIVVVLIFRSIAINFDKMFSSCFGWLDSKTVYDQTICRRLMQKL